MISTKNKSHINTLFVFLLKCFIALNAFYILILSKSINLYCSGGSFIVASCEDALCCSIVENNISKTANLNSCSDVKLKSGDYNVIITNTILNYSTKYS